MSLKMIEAGSGEAFILKAHQRLKIIDPRGGQTGDLSAFREGDITEWLSNGRSFDYGGTVYLTNGHVLMSNRSNPMLTIVHDDVGRHDFLYAPCSPESYQIQYGETGHKNCLTSIADALAHLGVMPHLIPTTFNLFMNVHVGEDGRLKVTPSHAKPGDAVIFRAEMDLAIAITSCPSLGCNGGKLGPLAYELLD
jgi:uncharacterized protein YcgI (DUF1989 family)